MKVLNFLSPFFFFLFVMSFSVSCGLFSDDSSEEDDAAKTKDIFVAADCKDTPRCEDLCKQLFAIETDLLNKCLEQDSSDVSQLNSVVSAMEKGNWDAIKPDLLEVLVEFDQNIWIKYSDVNSLRSQEMLLWVAKNEEIAKLLDEEQEVLRVAFAKIGAPAHEDKVVLKGMVKDIELERHRTFFEESVLNNNDAAFKATHELLKKECDESKICIKKLYCDLNKGIVFGKLNSLELGGDADLNGNTLNQEECD